MKAPKFLICENPMVNVDADEITSYIMHNGKTKIFAKATHFDLDDEKSQNEFKKQVDVGSSTTLEHINEYIVLSAEWIIPSDKIIGMDQQNAADELAGIMRRMADWYRAFLLWELESYDDE